MDKVGYSSFDLSYSKKTMTNFGDLLPVLCDEVVPGDILTLGSQLLIESAPTVDVVKHDVTADIYYYFVPYRILDDKFEDFIKGGLHGSTIGIDTTPKWKPDFGLLSTTTSKDLSKSLWLQMGFPFITEPDYNLLQNVDNGKMLPIVYPKTAYNAIYFYYYTQHIFDKPGEDKFNSSNPLYNNETILKCNWFNDYFTTALPYRQRGSAVNISGGLDGFFSGTLSFVGRRLTGNASFPSSLEPRYLKGVASVDSANSSFSIADLSLGSFSKSGLVGDKVLYDFSSAKYALDSAQNDVFSFPVDSLRQAIILQQYMELNTRSAEFYVDFIRKNFGVSSGDGRYNMPEYLGSSHTSVYFNEITNLNGASGSELGRRVANAKAVDSSYITKFRVPEYGLVMALLCIRPQNAYYGGINRQWLRHVNTDFYVPAFAHLPYQEVYTGELKWDKDSATVFGYQGRFDEMRHKQDMVCYPLQKSLPHRTYSRVFGDVPKLGKDFIRCDVQNNNFSYQNEAQFFVEIYHNIKATRPLPAYSQPLTF